MPIATVSLSIGHFIQLYIFATIQKGYLQFQQQYYMLMSAPLTVHGLAGKQKLNVQFEFCTRLTNIARRYRCRQQPTATSLLACSDLTRDWFPAKIKYVNRDCSVNKHLSHIQHQKIICIWHGQLT